VQLFLLPFGSHCSTQNIGFNDSGYMLSSFLLNMKRLVILKRHQKKMLIT